jgi:putative endonuclease
LNPTALRVFGVSAVFKAFKPTLISRHPDRSVAKWRDPRISLLFLHLRLRHTKYTFIMPDLAYVYIMASSFQRLYIGITTEIEVRVSQHKNGTYPNSFTSRYKINKLVYFERFPEIPEAIARERQLKNWSRIKKLRLIVAHNPTWQDLSADWGKPISLN